MQSHPENIAILGAAESGCGAAILAKNLGMEVFVSDLGRISDKYRDVLSGQKINFEENHHSKDRLVKADVVIKSPGIPDDAAIVEFLKNSGKEVISEIEFAGRHSSSKRICVTGSNGKTTTASLIFHILKKAGLDVVLAGNVGNSFAMELSQGDHAYFVLEISSFQLDGMFDFKADIAVLLNITPDHLDSYEYDFGKYVDSKFRITQNQGNGDAFIYCLDDDAIRDEMKNRSFSAALYPFSIEEEVEGEGAFVKKEEKEWNKNKMTVNINSESFNMTLENLALQGRHNIYNSMAASVVSRILDVRKDTIKESLSDFQNIEHRLEYVSSIHGIEFINDSKATNVNASWYALESFNKPIIWIAGGVDKGNDYSLLNELVKSRVKAIVCLGKDNSRIREAFAGKVETIIDTTSAEGAVEAAYYLGKPGDVVLLSPACASFDLFEDYEDRGKRFKAAVNQL